MVPNSSARLLTMDEMVWTSAGVSRPAPASSSRCARPAERSRSAATQLPRRREDQDCEGEPAGDGDQTVSRRHAPADQDQNRNQPNDAYYLLHGRSLSMIPSPTEQALAG